MTAHGTDHHAARAVQLWVAADPAQRNLERPGRTTVEAFGHRVVDAETIARAFAELDATVHPAQRAGFQAALRALDVRRPS